MDREVSPPPPKRLRLSHPGADKRWPSEVSVYSWNVNGIAPFVQRPITSYFDNSDGNAPVSRNATASLRSFLRLHQWPTVLFLQEIKVKPGDSATLRAIEAAVKSGNRHCEEPDYEAHFCLPSDKHNARASGGKVYGVCSIIRRDFSAQCVENVRTVDWDLEGRVQVIESKPFASRPKLAIINLYAVNGTDNPYKDSTTGKVNGTRHDRKLRVHNLLAAECRELQDQGFALILAGDMNIARTALDGYPNLRTFPYQHCINRAHFETIFLSTPFATQLTTGDDGAQLDNSDQLDSGKSLGMLDTFRELYPTTKAYTYYPRNKPFGQSCDRVDMILISSSLRDNLKEAGMHETPRDRGPSDHVPLYATFCFEYKAQP